MYGNYHLHFNKESLLHVGVTLNPIPCLGLKLLHKVVRPWIEATDPCSSPHPFMSYMSYSLNSVKRVL